MKSVTCQAVFLISSPLQALACWLILKKGNIVQSREVLIFLEGHYEIPVLPCVEIVKLKNTRREKKSINENIGIILSKVDRKIDLWVSDLLWPMNNAAYSTLLANGLVKSVNFVDEGVVMYSNVMEARYYYIRELLKSIVFKFYFKNYSILPRKMYSIGNGKIAVFNPHLVGDDLENIVEIPASQADIDVFSKYFIRERNFEEISTINGGDSSVLVLSQPYYRVMKSEYFNEILVGLKRYLEQIGSVDVYIKLHPSETLDDYNQYYRHLGFKLVFAGLRSSPVEIILSKLNKKVRVASFGTSAFVNGRKFGFGGDMIVYGLKKLVKQSIPFQAQLHINMLIKLYTRSGCVIVDHLATRND